MKKILLLTLLLTMSFVSALMIGIKPASAYHEAEVTLYPKYFGGVYPETKTFIVENLYEEADPIVQVVIAFPTITEGDTGFKPVDYWMSLSGWTATYEVALRQVTFRAADPNADLIHGGEEGTFEITFEDGPKFEGTYEWIVSTTDSKKRAHTYYRDQIIDRTKPTVVITYPGDGDTVEGEVWINATVTDNLCINTDSVALYLNGTLFAKPMDFDVVTEVDGRITKIEAYWYTPSLWKEAWYVALINATDCAGNPGEDEVMFYWKPTRLIITPQSGTVPPTTTYNKDTKVYTGKPFTYGAKTLGTDVKVEGGGYSRDSTVDVFVVHPHWGDILVVNDAETDSDTGYFEASFVFPTAPCGIYEIWAVDAEGIQALEPGWFTVVPEVIYMPEIVIGPAVIEIKATGLRADAYPSGEELPMPAVVLTVRAPEREDGTDALFGENLWHWMTWGTDYNGVLQTLMLAELGKKPGFVMPVLEPGTYEVNLTIFGGRCWIGDYYEGEGGEWIWPETPLETGNLLHVVNDFGHLMDAIDELEIKLDYLKPIIERIDGNVVTIKTDVGTIKADVEDIHPMVETIDGNVVTIKTDVGTIKGTVTSIQGDVATIKTDVGQVKVKADEILDEIPEPAEVTLTTYLPTVMSAIAAIAAIAAVVVVLRRLKVAA